VIIGCPAVSIRDWKDAMTIDTPGELRDEDRATQLVNLYLATGSTGRAQYSGAYFEQLGGGGDRPETARRFTAEDLLAVSMLSVRIDGYHALHVLEYQARELNGLRPRSRPASPWQTRRQNASSPKTGRRRRCGRRSTTSGPRPRTSRSALSQPASFWRASART
jgi:uncharacterized protein DUF6308